MAFKFPFTNYHELNLTWILEQLKKLFEDSAANVEVIENYNGRLTAVETELPLVSATAQDAAQTAAAAATLAQTAKATADTAQENAIQAQTAAGVARQEAQAAQTAADAATQAAEQAQSTALNFDGRITQAENDAAAALEASRSFENRVQSAITTSNNAAQTATNALGVATRADQNAALALDTLNAQRSELERIGAEQVELITEETENGKAEIEALIDTLPVDFTELVELVDKKAPVIIDSASGSVASFDDGADDMPVQKLVVDIEPVQAGNGDPSPTNIRPISGWTGAEIAQRGKNICPPITAPIVSGTVLVDFGRDITFTGVTLSFVFSGSFSSLGGSFIQIKTSDDTPVFSPGIGSYREVGTNNTLTANTTYSKQRVYVYGTGTITFRKIVLYNYPSFSAGSLFEECQIEDGVSLTNYVPYTFNQISVTFPVGAETVYGGTLTINSDGTGTLEVNKVSIDLGTANYVDEGASVYRLLTNPVAKPYTLIMSSFYTPFTGSSVNLPDNGIMISGSGTTYVFIRIKDSSVANVDELQARLVGQTAVYEILNTVIYQLSSADISGILKTVYGINNIFANTGDVTVDYPADTKLYIDGKLAELQATILENI